MSEILVVEDVRSNLRLVQVVLEKDGHVLHTAPDLATARALLAARTFDLIVLDLLMPDGFGLELAQEVRATPDRSHIPIIVLSAAVKESVQRAATAVGCNAFLTKPVLPEKLRAAVSQALEGG